MHRKDGTSYVIWQGAIDLGRDGTGKRQRRTVYGKNRKQVADKLDAMRAAQKRGTLTDGQLTVGEYLTDWLKAVGHSVSPSAHRQYEYLVETHLIPTLGGFKLDKLTASDVQGVFNGTVRSPLARKEKLSPRTRSHMRAVLRNALNDAVKRDLISRNAAARAKSPKQEDRIEAIRFLNQLEARHLLNVAKGDRLEALYVTALRIGARQGELLALRWSDVNFELGEISILKNLQRVDGKLVLRTLKTKHSRRTVPMSADLAAVLLAHKERQHTEQLLAAGRWRAEHDLVFRTTIGSPLEGTNVTKLFQTVADEKAGLGHMRFHDLRHSYASIALAHGVTLYTVSKLLGHSSITLTSDTYGHLLKSSAVEAADAMDRALAV
jgi:integrase